MLTIRAALIAIGATFLSIDAWGHVTLYRTTAYADVVTHVLFGMWLALFLIHREYRLRTLGALGIVFLVGIGWEFIELLYDSFLAAPYGFLIAQHGISDTAMDIASNTLGACIAIALFSFFKKRPAPLAMEVDSQ